MSTDDTIVEDAISRWRREEEAGRKKARTDVESILDILRRTGVQSVLVDYAGSGDSGSIENVTFVMKDGTDIEGINNESTPSHILNPIQEYVYVNLPGGWELNEGSSGTATIDTATYDIDVSNDPNPETEYCECGCDCDSQLCAEEPPCCDECTSGSCKEHIKEDSGSQVHSS